MQLVLLLPCSKEVLCSNLWLFSGYSSFLQKSKAWLLDFSCCMILPSRLNQNSLGRFFHLIVRFQWACFNCLLSFLLLVVRSGPWCGLLLLQPSPSGLTMWGSAFRDGILKSGYLSYIRLSVTAQSALTSEINKADCVQTGAAQWSQSYRCAWKSVDQQFLKFADQPVWQKWQWLLY